MLESVVSFGVPDVQAFSVLLQEPFVGVGAGGGVSPPPAGAPPTSYAPMSKAEPWGRTTPSLSVLKPETVIPAFIAGLSC